MIDSRALRPYLAGISALLLAGAAFAQSATEPVTPPGLLAQIPQGANLVIYREYAEPTIWASTVKIDGKKLASLGNKDWTATTISPGEHVVTVSWPFLSGQSSGAYDINVAEGRIHYLELLGQSQYAGAIGTTTYYRMGSGIAEVDPAEAPARILACCRFKASKN